MFLQLSCTYYYHNDIKQGLQNHLEEKLHDQNLSQVSSVLQKVKGFHIEIFQGLGHVFLLQLVLNLKIKLKN